MILDPYFYLVATPAVILTGLAKGGFAGIGLLAIPLMALAISPIQGAAILLPILMVQDVVTVWTYRRNVDWQNLAVMIPGASIGIALGYLLAAQVSDAELELAIGVMSIIFAIRRLFLEGGQTPPPKAQPNTVLGLTWGAVAGFTSMIANAGGPPFQIYVMPQKLDRDRYIGTSALFFAIINWIKVGPFILLGQFTADSLATSAALFPLAIASTFAGVAFIRRVSPDRFYVIVYGLLIAVGIKLVADGAHIFF